MWEMLRSERLALESSVKARQLQIKEKDLNNLTNFLSSLSTQSALLAGFSFVSFSELPDGTSYFAAFLLYTATSVSLGSNLFVVCSGMLASILAPTLALNGSDGAMDVAVTGLRRERSLVFKMFVIGLAAFFIMLDILIFIYTWIGVAIFSSLILTLFCAFTVKVCLNQIQHFQSTEARTGNGPAVAQQLPPVTDSASTVTTLDVSNNDDEGGQSAAPDSVVLQPQSTQDETAHMGALTFLETTASSENGRA